MSKRTRPGVVAATPGRKTGSTDAPIRASAPAWSEYGIPPLSEMSTVTASDGVRTFVAGWWHEPTKTFYKFLKPGHILQKPRAIALQVCVVEKLHRWRCERIVVITPDGDILTASFELFCTAGRTTNRGFGVQSYLLLHHWTSLRKTRLQPALTGLEV